MDFANTIFCRIFIQTFIKYLKPNHQNPVFLEFLPCMLLLFWGFQTQPKKQKIIYLHFSSEWDINKKLLTSQANTYNSNVRKIAFQSDRLVIVESLVLDLYCYFIGIIFISINYFEIYAFVLNPLIVKNQSSKTLKYYIQDRNSHFWYFLVKNVSRIK